MSADGIDVMHVMPQEPKICTLDHQFIDTYKTEVVRAFVKLDVLQNAAGRREMRPVVSSGGDLAVGRFGKLAENRLLRKRKNSDVYESENAKSDEDHDADDDALVVKLKAGAFWGWEWCRRVPA